MKDYTSDNPVFSTTLSITETSDPAHADIINTPLMQLFDNTLVLRALLGAGLTIIDFSIPVSAWQESSGSELYPYYADVSSESVSEEQIPAASVGMGSVPIAVAAGMSSSVETRETVVRFFAQNIPAGEIAGKCVLFLPSGSGGVSGGTGSTGDYVLPTATSTRLGGVKIGDGVDVSDDGTISPTKATDDEVDSMLKEVYGE